MRRGGPLKRTPLKRSKGIKPVNRARAKKRKAEAFGPQAQLCRESPCAVCGIEPADGVYTHPHHVVSRGSRKGGDEHCVPLCWKHHDEVGWSQVKFEAKYEIDLTEVARLLAEQLKEES